MTAFERPSPHTAGAQPSDDPPVHTQHPTEPAEGADFPGQDADLERAAHPEDPAEGVRDPT